MAQVDLHRVGDVGDIFELVVLGPARVSSLRAEIGRSSGDRRSSSRVWWAGHQRIRVESEEEPPAGESLYVQQGPRWWHWHAAFGATTNTLGDPTERPIVSEPLNVLMCHGRLALDPGVQILGRDTVAGREAVSLGIGERRIAIDAEHGVTLRALYRDFSWQVRRIVFDAPIRDDCFAFSVPEGVELRAASADRPVPMPVEDAAAQVDFPIFTPGPIVLSWPLDASVRPGRGSRPDVVGVGLRDARIWVHQTARPDPTSFGSRFGAPDAWKRVLHGDLELEIREDPAVVRTIRDGVHIEIHGETENLEQLIAVARSLRRVRPR